MLVAVTKPAPDQLSGAEHEEALPRGRLTRSTLLHADEVLGQDSERATHIPAAPSPPPQPQGLLQARPPSGLGLQGLAAPSLLPGSCSLRDLSCAWQGPASHVAAEGRARIPPHVRLFNSPSVPWSQNIQNHTLPALIYSADHPSTFKEDPNPNHTSHPLWVGPQNTPPQDS